MVELLKYATHYPELGNSMKPSSVRTMVLFITTFMPAASYINNIYLRAQLGEVIPLNPFTFHAKSHLPVQQPNQAIDSKARLCFHLPLDDIENLLDV